MASISTSQGFIRALKASSDPPAQDGQLKIEIARQVWENVLFHVPNKDEVVADWILGKFLKEKDKETTLNPLLDLRYWTLLRDVISATNSQTRPLKTWLPSLLSRIPFAPTQVALLRLLGDLESSMRRSFSQVVFTCLAIIWPISAQRLHTETLLECFSAFMSAYDGHAEEGDDFVRIGSLVSTSYRNSILNSSNKKKIYAIFVQTCLPRWLELVALSTSEDSVPDAIYDACIETLFNLDSLRRIADSKADDILFEAIAPVCASNSNVYVLLPRVFASYIEAIKKHRGALVSQSSTQASGAGVSELQTQGIQFAAFCISLLDADENSTQTWSARVALLEVIDKENLFDRRNADTMTLFERVIGQALAKIDVKTGYHLDKYCIECFSTLARIDYDMLGPYLPRILPKLLWLPEPSVLHLRFLDLILAYHNKTRTLNIYVDSLFNTLLTIVAYEPLRSPRDLYQSALSGPLFDATHLQHLSKALSTFLTGSQVLSLAKVTSEFLVEAWKQSDIAETVMDEKSPKRRGKMNAESPDAPNFSDRWPVVFSLSIRFAVIILSSLPWHAITEDVRTGLRAALSDSRDFARRIVKKSMKALKTSQGDNAWSLSIVSVASLRLWYALDIIGHLPILPFDDERLCKRASEALQDEFLLPELLLELARLLFHVTLHREQASSQVAFEHILVLLEKNFKAFTLPWHGQSHLLDKGMSGVALMHMILERWLPVLESFASSEQLERLVRTIMSIDIDSTFERSATNLYPKTLLLQSLHTAQFWELPRIRDVFLNFINQVISVPDDNAHSYSDKTSYSSSITAYRLLLVLPVEYLSRSSRSEFSQRALTLDRHIVSSNLPPELKIGYLTVLRAFLGRTFLHSSGSELSAKHLCEALEHLTSPMMSAVHNEDFETTSFSLLESLFLETIKKSDKSAATEFLLVLRALGDIDLESRQSLYFRARCIECLVTVLEKDFKFVGTSKQLQTTLQQFHRILSQSIYPKVTSFALEKASVEDCRHHTTLMTLWHSMLCLRKWLGETDTSFPFLGKQLSFRLPICAGSIPVHDERRVAMLSILLEEFNFCPEDNRPLYLDYIMAAYTTTYHSLQPHARSQVDGFLLKLCAGLSSPEYSQLLKLVADELVHAHSTQTRIQLLQTSATLLRSHPQGTLKQMQSFITRMIQMFLSWHGLLDGPIELRLQTLEFVVLHCTEQPAILRTGDMGSIWSFIANFLAGSHEHDSDTSIKIFHNIVTIISSLIRLRRDLIIHTLPHLCGILRQLLMTLRAVRPNLGMKQTSLVSDTLPRWLNSKQPIGVEEVKALARVFESLTIKSMIRNNAPSQETQKAESLAKPFSKHAAYVLKAYFTIVNDPLCSLPPEHRKELHRGLFALCSMVSDHSRDALMVGALDAGGKATMKALWKEYEKQRYIGKG